MSDHALSAKPPENSHVLEPALSAGETALWHRLDEKTRWEIARRGSAFMRSDGVPGWGCFACAPCPGGLSAEGTTVLWF